MSTLNDSSKSVSHCDCVNAEVFILGNLLSLPGTGKWLGTAFQGMVIRRSQLEHPGVDIPRLCSLDAIRAGTIEELNEYEKQYGEPPSQIALREAKLNELRHALEKRLGCSRSDSERVSLLLELVGEWSSAESEARKEWHGEFGAWIGLDEEQIKRKRLEQEYRLRTLAGREAEYRRAIKIVGDAILVSAAGFSGFSSDLLYRFLGSIEMTFNGVNPVQWPLEQWLPQLRDKFRNVERTESTLKRGDGPSSHELPERGARVFLVHGHDEDVLTSTFQHLDSLGLKYVVLKLEPSKGMTVIEKFVHYADVDFAIVLLTADDRGGTKSVTFADQRLRARQNVIFELGYFIGRLGRDRVCVLYHDGVELPSDYAGVVYIPLDNEGGWKSKLVVELKAQNLC